MTRLPDDMPSSADLAALRVRVEAAQADPRLIYTRGDQLSLATDLDWLLAGWERLVERADHGSPRRRAPKPLAIERSAPEATAAP